MTPDAPVADVPETTAGNLLCGVGLVRYPTMSRPYESGAT